MTDRDDRNVAYKHRRHRGDLASAALLAAVLAGAPAAPVEGRAAAAGSSPPAPEATTPPPARPPEIRAPALPDSPAAGKGRLALHVGGNRRWCTFPDDRLVRPPETVGRMDRRN